ncbi:hypothetical protein F5884DRAFT_880051 [Xylogone sp. PMI_703]|nr:hypothetical protein F5884DRAFT_880051 [Xylogone sp. PMI_703]
MVPYDTFWPLNQPITVVEVSRESTKQGLVLGNTSLLLSDFEQSIQLILSNRIFHNMSQFISFVVWTFCLLSTSSSLKIIHQRAQTSTNSATAALSATLDDSTLVQSANSSNLTTITNATISPAETNASFDVFQNVLTNLNSRNYSNPFKFRAPESANISEALAAYNATWNEFQRSSNHQGNITGLHIQGYYALTELLANYTCDEVAYQILDHDRFLQSNYTSAIQYGTVLGNFTAKHIQCLNSTGSNMIPSNSDIASALEKRSWVVFAGAAVATAIIGVALNNLYTEYCTWYFGDGSLGGQIFGTSSPQNCVGIAWAFSLVGVAALIYAAGLSAPVAGTAGSIFAGASNFVIYDSNFQAAEQISNNRRSLAGQVDWNATTTLRHGLEDRNLTVLEFAGANFTLDRAIMLQTLPGTNISLPMEFWHQPHPTKPGNYTHHVGFHPGVSAEQLAKRHLQRRQSALCIPESENSDEYWYEMEEMEDNGDYIDICDTYDVNGESFLGGPGSYYFGFDEYTPSEASAWEWDMGITNFENNGFATAVDAGADLMLNTNGWDECVCFQENSQWLATGSMQFSWDNTYNGYSDCWNADCDGA